MWQTHTTVGNVAEPSEPRQEPKAERPIETPEPTQDGAPRPLLFLDVDGPLNPYAAKPTRRPAGYATHWMRPSSWADSQPSRLFQLARHARSLRVWLNPAHGPKLLELQFDLVWATTWEHDANIWIGPVIGLPELPVVTFEPYLPADDDPDGLYWKTRTVVDYAAGRPFAWVDDYLTSADLLWCAENYPAPALLLPIDPACGLDDGDFAALAHWAALCGEGGADR